MPLIGFFPFGFAIDLWGWILRAWGSWLLSSTGLERIVMARKGKLASGLISGIDLFSSACSLYSGVRLSFKRADVVAALLERGSTADSSTADGVGVVGRAVAEGSIADEGIGIWPLD